MKHVKKRARKKGKKEKGRKEKDKFQGTVGNIKHCNMYKWSQSREAERKKEEMIVKFSKLIKMISPQIQDSQ